MTAPTSIDPRTICVVTSCDLDASRESVWTGITNAAMTQPRPLCFNLGVPLPVKCEITQYEDGQGTQRQCTSNRGYISQEITDYDDQRRLAFRMKSHTLKTLFPIAHMEDDLVLDEAPGGGITLTRTTRIKLPQGALYGLRALLLRRSLRSVHRYVYANIQAAATPGAVAL